MSEAPKKLAVVGVGNILMGDDGVGVALLERLGKRVNSGEVDFIDAGTGFFLMVSDLDRYETVVILDAARGGGEAGSMYRFEMKDLHEIVAFQRAPISLHDFGVPESLAWEKARGRLRAEVIFFGIEPRRVGPVMGLSEELEERVPAIVRRILEELARHGIDVKLHE